MLPSGEISGWAVSTASHATARDQKWRPRGNQYGSALCQVRLSSVAAIAGSRPAVVRASDVQSVCSVVLGSACSLPPPHFFEVVSSWGI